MKILCYNSQRGVKGWEFLNSLIQEQTDLVCLQRFPKDWCQKIQEPFVYQASFLGSDNGCLTIQRTGKLVGRGSSTNKAFGQNFSQSTAVIESRVGGHLVSNSLGPYPSPEEGVSDIDYKTHLQFLFRRYEEPTIIVGDMHFDQMDFPEVDFFGFTNFAKLPNFYDPDLRPLNLTKCFANHPIELKERLLIDEPAPGRHMPVLFEISQVSATQS